MIHLRRLSRHAVLLLLFSTIAAAQQPAYRYFRVGNSAERPAIPQAGFALMGGGKDLDDAFRWLCRRANGGDFLVLRAAGDDEYNSYIQQLCPLNSVATLVIPSRSAAEDPFVVQKIREASGVFIAGGDQARYINFWMGTPVQSALNDSIGRGVPVGGTSAGLAVLGEYAYSAQGDKPDDPNLDGKTAMADPFGPRITLVRGFLDIPILQGMIADTHFAKRNRMGRLLTFLARLNEPEAKPAPPSKSRARAIGVQERTAVLLEADGHGTVVGRCCAYFIDAGKAEGPVAAGKPLTFGPFDVQRVAPGHSFDVKEWRGDATRYTLQVTAGAVRSTQPRGAVY
jgi:cyanophycinase